MLTYHFLCRLQVSTNPIMQLHGLTPKSVHALEKELQGEEATALLWKLRSMPREQAASILKKVPRGRGNQTPPLHHLLDSLYWIPSVKIQEAKITHTVDKASGKSRGQLQVRLEIDRGGENAKKNAPKDSFVSLTLALGSAQRRLLLGVKDVSLSRSGTWTVEKTIDFDWESANADGGQGGGVVVLRLLLDSIRGMDAEQVIRLR